MGAASPTWAAPGSGAPPVCAATSAVTRCPAMPLAIPMAVLRVWPAMLAPSVPARGLVETVIDGRSARIGATALVPKSRSLDEKLGGITTDP